MDGTSEDKSCEIIAAVDKTGIPFTFVKADLPKIDDKSGKIATTEWVTAEQIVDDKGTWYMKCPDGVLLQGGPFTNSNNGWASNTLINLPQAFKNINYFASVTFNGSTKVDTGKYQYSAGSPVIYNLTTTSFNVIAFKNWSRILVCCSDVGNNKK